MNGCLGFDRRTGELMTDQEGKEEGKRLHAAVAPVNVVPEKQETAGRLGKLGKLVYQVLLCGVD